MKKIFYLLLFVLLISCKTYTTIVTNKVVSEREISLTNILLEKDEKIITFIDKLSDSEITVFADTEIIFKGYLEFNNELGASKGVKFSSTTKKIAINWDNENIKVKVKKDYPFIYVSKKNKTIVEHSNVPKIFN